MRSWLVSLVLGFGVGVAYGLLRVRSPAPPLVALVGLLGMLLGEQAVAWRRQAIAPPEAPATSSPPTK
jgi:XapX domain-containing protein